MAAAAAAAASAAGSRRLLLVHSSLLLLGLCLHGAAACKGDGGVTFKKVGDTVEFSPCVSGNVTQARWRYNFTIDLYRQNVNVAIKDRFKDRVQVTPGDFNLTVTQLTTEDSGVFQFTADQNGRQFPTRKFTLDVREPLTRDPELKTQVRWHPENQSCSVFVDCRAAVDQNVSFRLAVGNHSYDSSSLDFSLNPSDGDAHVSCIVSNPVSDKRTEKTVTCTNETQSSAHTTTMPENFIVILSGSIAGGLLLVVLVAIVVIVCHCNMKQTVASKDTDDLTVYADITENMADARGSSTMTPCSLYDTIENVDKHEPQTVYDKIQLARIRKTSVSPYQEVI